MKNIKDVAARLNRVFEQSSLSDFYAKRAQLKNGRRFSGGLLREVFGGSEDLDGYAFHTGGRSEIQYNVGFEEGGYFRYGLAFSLEPSRTLTDPVGVLRPKIKRFNSALAQFPELNQFRMWWYANGLRSIDHQVSAIPDALIRTPNFIFIGERVRVGRDGVSPTMLERAAVVMESLFSVYAFVEGEASTKAAPFKVARLCWNTQFWQAPTGRVGKTRNVRSFEAQNGFGHEEWLFDHTRLIDGWKYGFVQALNRSHGKYAGQTLNLLLYTIDDRTKSRFWIATIRNAFVLTTEEAKAAGREFQGRGWMGGMQEQVRHQGLDPSTISDTNPIELTNLRYRPEDLMVFQPPIQFSADTLPAAYYGNLLEVPETQRGLFEGKEQVNAITESNINTLKAHRQAFYSSATEIDLIHKQWQQKLKASLPKALPRAKISVEAILQGHRVDAVIEQNKKKIFVELKTRSIVRHAIREALSQLLEYCYWPPAEHRAHAMLIVSAGTATDEDSQYLTLLRERFNIPVYYLPYRDGEIVGISGFVASLMHN